MTSPSFGASDMENVLNLPRYTVLSVKEEPHDYHIDVETVDPPGQCLECGSDNIVGGGRQEILIKDLPMHGKRVGIYVKARRFRCRDCGKTITERLPDVADGQRMTNRLHQWICRESVERTFVSIANEVGVSEGTVRGIFNDYIKRMEQDLVFETPIWMGIDEIHIIKKPRCVISNIENNTVVDMLTDRSKVIITNYLMRMPRRQSVKCVTMDMWRPYKDVVNSVLPNAFIVVDKFHVLRMAQKAMEDIRKNIREALTTKQRRGLLHDRFLMLKREHELTEFERMNVEVWTRNFPALMEAYRAKERFFSIYDAMDIPEAEGLYSDWLTSLPPQIKEAFTPLITAMGNWRTEIMAHFDHPVTNAYTESLNNLIRFTNRCGRGYSFEALRAKVLFSAGAHKIIKPRFERKAPADRMYKQTFAFSMGEPTASTQRTINYGVDTSTLLKLAEEGRI